MPKPPAGTVLLFAVGVTLAACASASSDSGRAPAALTSAAPAPPLDSHLLLTAGFYGNTIANVPGARELAMLPNGDLLAGTKGQTIYIVPNADGPGAAGSPQPFITLSDQWAAGVAYAPNGSIYAATSGNVWRIPYTAGDRTETSATSIAKVRTSSSGDHVTTSVAASRTQLYVGVGSSCDACIETDPTRAAVLAMNFDGSNVVRLAKHTRNPIALTVNPATQSLWIAGAGQDGLPYGHPYEYFDSPTLRGSAGVDYGWPACEENHHLYNPLNVRPPPDCSQTIAPAVEFPAYSTLMAATFYPVGQSGPYAFPAAYQGAVFVTSHGSWHCCPATPPVVSEVPMNGDQPATPVDWSDPTAQSRPIMTGFGSTASTAHVGRPVGLAIGPNGSLFVADDQTGNIYRIRHQ